MAPQSRTLIFRGENLLGENARDVTACTLLLRLTGGGHGERVKKGVVKRCPVIWRATLPTTGPFEVTYADWNAQMVYHMPQFNPTPGVSIAATEQVVKLGEKTSLVVKHNGPPPLYGFDPPEPNDVNSSSVVVANDANREATICFGYKIESVKHGVATHDVRIWKNTVFLGTQFEPDERDLDPFLSAYVVYVTEQHGGRLPIGKPIWEKALSKMGTSTIIRISMDADKFVANEEKAGEGAWRQPSCTGP